MDKVKQIQALQRNANEIHLGFAKMDEYRKNTKHHDKIGYGFSTDERFQAHNPIKLMVSSHHGTYGDSGCSSIVTFDSDIFNKHLRKVLSNNFEFLMKATADSITEEAKTLKAEALKEIQGQNELVNSL